jgi:hypothetical protein
VYLPRAVAGSEAKVSRFWLTERRPISALFMALLSRGNGSRNRFIRRRIST